MSTASAARARDPREAIQTHSGRRFWPLDPDPAAIALEDIGHALSLISRFNGHTDRFYSVAQHSVLVSLAVPAELGLWALLHDASEAYLGDVSSPIKGSSTFREYRRAEAYLQTLIFEAFGLFGEMPAEVHEADRRILAAEIRDLTVAFDVQRWAEAARAWPTIVPVDAVRAESMFFSRFDTLRSSAVAAPQADGVPYP